METLLWLLALQGVLGAFDIVYHHELTERLTWRRSAAFELKLHGIRNLLYGVLYLGLGWFRWQGLWAWLFGLILLAEVGLTLWDFVVEDRTRRLPAGERITHALLALNYGMILALLFPVLRGWAGDTTAMVPTDLGLFSWLYSFYGAGVLFWAWRDLHRGRRLSVLGDKKPLLADTFQRPLSVLVTGGTGLVGSRLCAALAEAGNQVTVLTRDRRRAMALASPLAVIEGLDEIPATLHFDAIVNLAGEPIASGRCPERLRHRASGSCIPWPMRPSRPYCIEDQGAGSEIWASIRFSAEDPSVGNPLPTRPTGSWPICSLSIREPTRPEASWDRRRRGCVGKAVGQVYPHPEAA